MEIPRSLLSELTDAVNALSASAQALAATALDDILKEWDGADVAGLRVKCIEALEAIESAYCDAFAAGRAAEFYEGCRAAQGVRGAYSAVADSRRDPQALAGAVRAMVQYAADGDTDRYRRECLSRIDADVRRSANSCVAYNARRDPKKPKYARVPSGGETCGFCLMLSSFGFHYTTEEAAGHAHDGCDCRVVPNFGKASVKGYDADGMYSRYNDVLDTLGGRDGIRAEWEALPREEREAYIASHGKKEDAAFQKYLNKRVSQEIEANGAVWFQEGDATLAGRLSKASAAKTGNYTSENLVTSALSNKELKRMKKEKPLEWSGYVRLSELGYPQTILHEDRGASSNVDIEMNVDGETHYWELKTPKAGVKALKKLLRDGCTKWQRLSEPGAIVQSGVDLNRLSTPRLVIDNRYSRMSDADAEKQILADMEYLPSVTRVSDFNEAILIMKDGAAKHLRK